MPMEEEEYEIIPISPIRRVERRMERLEKVSTSNEMIKELIDVVRTNQKIIDEVVKINTEMINRVAELSTHVSDMTGKLNDFLGKVEVGGDIGEPTPTMTPDVDQRMEKLEKRINSLLISAVRSKQLRPQTPSVRK